MSEEESRPAKALRVFCETITGELDIERTEATDRLCETILLRLATKGVVVMAFPEAIAERLAENGPSDIRLRTTTSTVEAVDNAEADLPSDPVPHDGGERAARDDAGDGQQQEAGR